MAATKTKPAFEATVPEVQPYRVGWTGSFAAGELEDDYRRQQLSHDIATARMAVMLVAGFTALFIVPDYRLFGRAPTFWLLAGGRLLLIAAAGYILLRLRDPIAVAGFEGLIGTFAMSAIAFNIFVTYTRPNDYAGQGVVSVSLVLICYVLIPLPLALQAAPALFMTLGSLLLLFWYYPPGNPMTARAFAAAYLFNNAVGLLTSRQLHGWKRQQFHALLKERELRAGLERAMQEIKTLRGILPICAHCKRVRNDVGYWQQVEVYVKERTHAEFSHSICPDCMETHFGETLKKRVRLDEAQ